MKNLSNFILISMITLSIIAFIVTSITLDEKCGASMPQLPHIFQGYAKYGNSVLVNKTVTATLDGVDFSSTTDSSGFYNVHASRCSDSIATAITFTVCTRNASETATFSEGAVNLNFNLTILSECPNGGGGGGGGGGEAERCNVTLPIPTNYSTKRINFNITLSNNTEHLKYINYNNSKPRERTLCVGCNEYGNTRTRTIIFEEGYPNISIFTDDGLCNQTISFFVDSTKPRVSRQEPRNKKYCNGNFNVTYTEEYLRNVYLYYENNILVKNDCPSGRNKECGFYALLSEYENQSINFHFEIEDTFWKIPYRINYTCLVDTIPPKFTYFNWRVNGRYLYLNISLDDEAESLKYIYYSDSKATERTLCLKCNEYGASRIRRVPFRRGNYTLRIVAEDEAENKETRNINFTIDY